MKSMIIVATVCVLAVGGMPSTASADVSMDYARDHWNPKGCFVATEDGLVVGDITGDGRSDAVMLWTCGSGAGGAQPRIVSVWIDGDPITKKSLTLPLPKASTVRVREGRVIILGGDYSGPGIPRCCPDVKVKLTYEWNGKRLSLVDVKRTPMS